MVLCKAHRLQITDVEYHIIYDDLNAFAIERTVSNNKSSFKLFKINTN